MAKYVAPVGAKAAGVDAAGQEFPSLCEEHKSRAAVFRDPSEVAAAVRRQKARARQEQHGTTPP